jgi:hypothetical protein
MNCGRAQGQLVLLVYLDEWPRACANLGARLGRGFAFSGRRCGLPKNCEKLKVLDVRWRVDTAQQREFEYNS